MNRRKFLGNLFCAPAIVAYGSLMPVKLVDWTTKAPMRARTAEEIAAIINARLVASDKRYFADKLAFNKQLIENVTQNNALYQRMTKHLNDPNVSFTYQLPYEI